MSDFVTGASVRGLSRAIGALCALCASPRRHERHRGCRQLPEGRRKGRRFRDRRHHVRPATVNQGGVTTCGVDQDGHDHCVLKFPNIFGNGANQIPLGSTIVSATLTLYVENDGANDGLSCPQVFQLTESWTEAQATWDLRSTGVNWANPGADGTASHKPVAEGIIGCDPIGFYNLAVTTSVQNWSSGEANHGWALIDQGPSVDGIDFTSSEGVDPRQPSDAHRQLHPAAAPEPGPLSLAQRQRNGGRRPPGRRRRTSKLVALPKGTTRRLRFGVANTGAGAANVQYRLQVGFSNTCASALYSDGAVSRHPARTGRSWTPRTSSTGRRPRTSPAASPTAPRRSWRDRCGTPPTPRRPSTSPPTSSPRSSSRCAPTPRP